MLLLEILWPPVAQVKQVIRQEVESSTNLANTTQGSRLGSGRKGESVVVQEISLVHQETSQRGVGDREKVISIFGQIITVYSRV